MTKSAIRCEARDLLYLQNASLELKSDGRITRQAACLDWEDGAIAIEVRRDSGDIMANKSSTAQIGICGFLSKSITDDAKNPENHDGIPAAWSRVGVHRVATSSYSGSIHAIFYGCDTSLCPRGMVLKP